MQKKPNWDRIAILFSILIFFVYLCTLSISLDDWDSVQFALGLREFNVVKHQPHPFGFPVYILLGTLLNALFKNELLSLTLLSALSGALSVFATYLLAKELFNREIAIGSAALTALTPLFWLNSVKAMSDMPALFFTLLALLFFFKYVKCGKPGSLYSGALIAGIAAGVRVHALFILLPAMAYGIFLNRKNAKAGLRGCIFFALSVLAWFLPLILITGAAEYFSAAGALFNWRVGNPGISVLGTEPGLGYLAKRAFDFIHYFLLGGYGINLLSLKMPDALLLLFMAALLVFSLKKIHCKDKKILFFALPTGIYLLAIFILLPPTNPRYLLIAVPLLSMVFANAIWRLKNTKLRNALFIALIALVSLHSLPPALEIHGVPTPPVQLISYINENYGGGDFIVLNSGASRHFDYYATAVSKMPGTNCEKIKQLLSENKTVLSLAGSTRCTGLQLKRVAVFERSPMVHIKHNKAPLYKFVAST